MTKGPFLRWSLVNVAFLAALAGASIAYDGEIHGAGKAAALAALCVYVAASAHAGVCAWNGTGSKHVSLAVRACPMVAMLGTVAGFLISFSGDASDVQQRVLGASTGLVATFVGVSCALVLMLLEHLGGGECSDGSSSGCSATNVGQWYVSGTTSVPFATGRGGSAAENTETKN